MNLSELKNRLQVLYNPDPSGTKRRVEIKNEHYSGIKISATRRDAEIEQAKQRHADEIANLDRLRTTELENLDLEVKKERREQKEFDCLLEKLNDYATKIGERKYIPNDFAPATTSRSSSKTSLEKSNRSKSSQSSSVGPSTNKDHTPNTSAKMLMTNPKTPAGTSQRNSLIPNGLADLSMGISFSVPSRAPGNTVDSGAAIPVSQPNKRKSYTMEQSNTKKQRIGENDEPPISETQYFIEETPIVPQLRDVPYIFISAWDISVKVESIRHLKQMVELYNFYPTAVRADASGYFFVFEGDERGNREASDCFDRVKSIKFRHRRTNMKLFKIGERQEE